jgi:hypothetical protein
MSKAMTQDDKVGKLREIVRAVDIRPMSNNRDVECCSRTGASVRQRWRARRRRSSASCTRLTLSMREEHRRCYESTPDTPVR